MEIFDKTLDDFGSEPTYSQSAINPLLVKMQTTLKACLETIDCLDTKLTLASEEIRAQRSRIAELEEQLRRKEQQP